MSKHSFNEFRNEINNLSFNKVKKYFFIYHHFIQSCLNYNESAYNKSILGRKRNLENIRQTTISQNNTDPIHFSSSNLNKINDFSAPKLTKELSNFYNMERSICFSCVKAKNKKYPTNEFIPCIPSSISS